MPSLSEYSNVYNTATALLQEKGFQVWHDKETDAFCAEKDGWDFQSESPVGLLGLISIYEFINPQQYSEYWWRHENDVDCRDLPRLPAPYHPVWLRKS